MKPLLPLLLCLLAHHTICFAQQVNQLTLAECYSLAEQNYPQVKQRELIARTSEYNIGNIQKGYLPRLSVNGQASYQSAVTQIPIKIPGVNIPTLSKDQYKLYGEVNQVVYDGGIIHQQEQVEKSGAEMQQHQLESELYQLRNRINQLFFGILLIDQQLKQNDLLNKDIQLGLNNVQAAINNGTALRSNADVLNADLLKNKQRAIELRAARKTFTGMLGLFTAKKTDDSTVFIRPPSITNQLQISRPELKVYDAQRKNLDAQQQLLTKKIQPTLALFLQGGAGRPALNFLSNNFEPYYIGGLRLIWSPSTLYTLRKEKAIIDIRKENVEVQKETFLFNTSLEVNQQNADVSKYQELLSSDDEIIALRTRIKTASLAQLENGVINSSDYLREANAEDQARQNKIIHEIQLLNAGYTLQTTTGNQQ